MSPTAKLTFEQAIQGECESFRAFISGMVIDLRGASRKKFLRPVRLPDNQLLMGRELAKRRQYHTLIKAVDIGLKHTGELVCDVHVSSIARTSSNSQDRSNYRYRTAWGQPIIRRDDGAFLTADPKGIPDDVRACIEARVRERGPVPMTDQMFRHGRNYHECALRCLELRGDGQTFLFPPALVLLSFVVEIYLKALLAIEGKVGKELHGHDHCDLYGRLTTETQTSIVTRYQHRHGQLLSEDLPGYADLFVKYRYAYELEGAHEADISGVAQLASSLYETLAEGRPDLTEAGIVHDRITAPSQGVPIVVDGTPATDTTGS